MGNNKELLLVHASMESVTSLQAVNVMLPPQFYTVKKEALPVRWAYQAKRIAPSFFDGLLEGGKHYDYMVWKERDEWVFLAYDIEMIASFLTSKGFVLENISKVFFAEQAIDSFEKPILLGDNEALVSLDHTAVIVPRRALSNEEGSLGVFNNSFTPKQGVALEGAYGSILNVKQASILATLFSLFAIIFFVEGWRYGHNSKAGEADMQQLLESYPSLQSKYTRDSVAEKYKKIDTVERKKRETVKRLSKMIFKGVTLTSFVLNEKHFNVEFACSDAKVAKRLNTLAQKEKFSVSKIAGSNDLHIKGTL